jgi:outer membrane protein assembly factor BamD
MLNIRATSLILIGFFTISGSLFLSGCGSDEKKADTAESSYELAQQYDKDERYEESIRRYQEIKNKYPYSKYAVLSELAIADANFKQESYPEAQVAYQNFKDLHPKHPQIDYVTFRLALSYYNQLPPTSDRDLSLASNTILNFDEVLHQYPNSEYVKEAQEKKLAVLKLLAEKEIYIADFYFKKGQWDSARLRYEGEIKKYPGQEFEARALSRAVICAARASEMDRAHELLARLRSQFPGSSELKAAEGEVK